MVSAVLTWFRVKKLLFINKKGLKANANFIPEVISKGLWSDHFGGTDHF